MSEREPTTQAEQEPPLMIDDATLADPRMKKVVTELRPTLTLGQWFLVCAALDHFSELKELEPEVRKMADDLFDKWSDITIQLGAKKLG